MWPFIPQKLYDRYGKLMKLIMSIDSHFEVTENKEDSVRLHLPNYKGNQPMDFHIYLMEPFLFINFITEIEGEKISVANSYPQDTDQQDMFNMAMANNMNKIHQVLEKKYIDNEEQHENISKQTNENTGLNFFDFNESVKKHALTTMMLRPGVTFMYFSEEGVTTPLWLYNSKEGFFCDHDESAIGASAFVWMMQKYQLKEDFCWMLDFLNSQNMDLWSKVLDLTIDDIMSEIKRNIPDFKLGNDPERVKTSLQYAWIDLQSFLRFIDYCTNNVANVMSTARVIHELRECTTIEELARLFLSDFKVTGKIKKEGEEEESSKISVGNKNLIGIKKTWPLIEFAREHGKMQVGEFANKGTGEVFKACIFTKPNGTRTFVAFAAKMGELTPKQIAAMKDELQVVQLESGNYSLCKIGSRSWEKVDLSMTDSGYKESMSTEVSEDDLTNAWTDEYGVKYSADRKKLLKAPREIENHSVIDGTRVICDMAFSMCNSLKSIFIPNSVTCIGYCTFSNCYSLTSIILSNSLKSIGSSAFAGCRSLTSITIPSSVTSIGNSAFYDCRSLTSIEVNEQNKCYDSRDNCNAIIETESNNLIVGCSSTIIPENVTKIGGGAFSNREALTSILIPDSVTTIAKYAFSGCRSLTSITIPSSVTTIDESVFSECESLSSIVVDEHNKCYNSRDNCNAIIETKSNILIVGCSSTVIPDNITSIGDGAFIGNGLLGSIVIPNSVTSIGKNAFQKCKSLTSIIIPDSVTSIGERAFEGCVKLSSINIPKNIIKIENDTFYNCCSLTSIVIPHNVKAIGGFAFRNTRISDLVIPDGVIEIGEMAFSNCNLNTVTIADSVEKIDSSAFENGNSSPSFYIHVGQKDKFAKLLPGYERRFFEREHEENQVKVTHKDTGTTWADENGTPYTIDYMPNSSKSDNKETDGDLMNEDEVSHTEGKTDDELENFWTDEYGAQYSEDKKRLLYVPENVEEYSIAEGTEEIGDYAFVNIEFENVSYDYIMENDLDIHDFERHPSKLISVCISESVTKIGKGIFDWCTKLAVISIPEGTKERFVTMLPDYKDILIEGDISTAAHVEDLENAWIDNSGVKYSVDKRKLLKAPSDISKYTILPGTKIICDGAFFECANLVNLHLPESIIIIGKYSFYGCENLMETNLPKAIKRIGDHAFDECYALSSLYVSKTGYTQFARLIPSHYQKIKESPLNSVMDEQGVVYDNDYQILHFNTLPLDAYTVESGVKVIDHYAFEPTEWKKDNGKSLKRLYLPDSIAMIGDAAFANNQALEYINIPKNAAFFIDDNPFAGCTSLHTIKWETEKAVKEGTLVYNQERTALIACLPWHYIGGVIKSWPLLDFARQHGKMQVGEFKNQQTGELFKSCIFTNPHNATRTFAAFNDAMGVLTPKEIVAQKNELVVVQLESGNYSLCKGRVIIEQDSQVEVPYGVKTIAAHAFYHNDVLQEITLPATIETIGEDVFEGCKSLRAIYIPKDLLPKFEKMLTKWRHLLVEKKDLLPF